MKLTKIVLNTFAFIGIAAIIVGVTDLFLDAADREAAFQENLREARCERMNDTQKNMMKEYCK